MKYNVTIKDLISSTNFLTTLGKTYAQRMLISVLEDLDVNRESSEDLLYLGAALKGIIDSKIAEIIANKKILSSNSDDINISRKPRYHF